MELLKKIWGGITTLFTKLNQANFMTRLLGYGLMYVIFMLTSIWLGITLPVLLVWSARAVLVIALFWPGKPANIGYGLYRKFRKKPAVPAPRWMIWSTWTLAFAVQTYLALEVSIGRTTLFGIFVVILALGAYLWRYQKDIAKFVMVKVIAVTTLVLFVPFTPYVFLHPVTFEVVEVRTNVEEGINEVIIEVKDGGYLYSGVVSCRNDDESLWGKYDSSEIEGLFLKKENSGVHWEGWLHGFRVTYWNMRPNILPPLFGDWTPIQQGG